MKIIKYLIVDFFFLIAIVIIFLFNRGNDGKVNILMSVLIGTAAFIFETMLLIYYIISRLWDFYSRITHVILFFSFVGFVNVVSILYLIKGEIIGGGFYLFVLFFSIASSYCYNKLIGRIDEI